MAAEAAAAAVLLAVLAVVLHPARPAPPSPDRAWSDRARPRIGALLADISAVSPVGPTVRQEVRLEADLRAARAVPPAPEAAWDTEWTRALADIDGALPRSAPAGSAPPAGPAAYLHLSAAGEALLALSQVLPGSAPAAG